MDEYLFDLKGWQKIMFLRGPGRDPECAIQYSLFKICRRFYLNDASDALRVEA